MEYLFGFVLILILIMVVGMMVGITFWMVDSAVFDGKLSVKFKSWAQSYITE